MYIPLIKEKHSLVDLARYGTRSRKNIHPDVLIGLHPCPPLFKEGDILDANAVLNLIKTLDPTKNEEIKTLIKRNKELAEKAIKTVSDREEQLENVVEELEQKHDQDIQDLKLYVVSEVDKAKAIVVYDESDENLLVYNVKT